MKWSLRIARVAGIGIYVHWTFLILLGWIVIAHLAAGEPLPMIAQGLAFVLAIFACVVLHELGHALMAKRFGVQTRDITLLPIGGVARLEKIPERPWQEFWVAVAGPAVNVVIALLLLAGLVVSGGVAEVGKIDEAQEFIGGPFLARLMVVNLILVGFNLLPAFPMDGGRVLRALLATRMDRVRATQIAASVGQVMAMFFGLLGITSGNWVLLFIALFVYLGAQGEAQAAELRSIFQNVLVSEAMATQVHCVTPDQTLKQVTESLIAGHQQDFPVLDAQQQVVGILHRRDLLRALAQQGDVAMVRDVMHSECPTVQPDGRLDQAMELMQQAECSTLPVLRDGEMVGVLTSENIGEWAMIQSALRQRRARQPHSPSLPGGASG